MVITTVIVMRMADGDGNDDCDTCSGRDSSVCRW